MANEQNYNNLQKNKKTSSSNVRSHSENAICLICQPNKGRGTDLCINSLLENSVNQINPDIKFSDVWLLEFRLSEDNRLSEESTFSLLLHDPHCYQYIRGKIS